MTVSHGYQIVTLALERHSGKFPINTLVVSCRSIVDIMPPVGLIAESSISLAVMFQRILFMDARKEQVAS